MKPACKNKNPEHPTSAADAMEVEEVRPKKLGNTNDATRTPIQRTDEKDMEANLATETCNNSTYDASWEQAISRRTKQKMKKEMKIQEAATKDTQAPEKSEKSAPKFNVAHKRRIPNLPKDDFKIVIRPKGMPISSFTVPQLTQAIARACPSGVKNLQETIVRPKWNSNIILVSTSNQEAANEFRNIEALAIGEKKYDVKSYVAFSDQEVKGVVHGFEPGTTSEELMNGLRVRTIDTKIVFARMLGKSSTALVTFEGNTVPRAVYFYGGEMTCYLYKATRLVCHICRKTGHRADVCPEPNANICSSCGEGNPARDHKCTPKCALCQKEHHTGSKECELKFRSPRIPPGNRSKISSKQRRPRWFDDEWPELEHHPEPQERDDQLTQGKPKGPGTKALKKKSTREDDRIKVSWADAASQDYSCQKRKTSNQNKCKDEIAALKELILDIKAENAMLRKKLEKYERSEGRKPTQAETELTPSPSGARTLRILDDNLISRVNKKMQEFKIEIEVEIKKILTDWSKATGEENGCLPMDQAKKQLEQANKRKLEDTQTSKNPKQIIIEKEKSNMDAEFDDTDLEDDP